MKCQAGKSSRSAHKPWPRQKAYFQIRKRFMLGQQRKNPYGSPGQNVMQFRMLAWSLQITSYAVFDQDLALEKI